MEGVLVLPCSSSEALKPLLAWKQLRGWSLWFGSAGGDGLAGPIDENRGTCSLAEVNWKLVDFPTYLIADETGIKGEVKLARINEAGDNVFGGNAFMRLWEDYEQNGPQSHLELIHQIKGVDFIDFLGSVLRKPTAERFTPSLSRNASGWHRDLICLDDVQFWSGHVPVSLRMNRAN